MDKIKNKEWAICIKARKKTLVLAKIVAQCNIKTYLIKNDGELRAQTLSRLKEILNNDSDLKREFDRHTIKPTEKNLAMAKEARICWQQLTKKRGSFTWLLKNVCSLNACYQM